MAGNFNPQDHMIRVQGGKDYLPVAWRLVWFRQDHPEWGIVTEPVEINHEKQYAIFRANIFNDEGRLIATGTKKEDVRGFGDYIEKAETGSIGRALALCGYGTQFEPDLDEKDRLADSPQHINREVQKRQQDDGTFGGDEEASNVRREAVRDYGKKFQEFVQVIYGLGMIPDGWNKDQLEAEVINLANKHFKTFRTENNLLEKLPDAQQLTKMLTHYRKLLHQKSEHDAAQVGGPDNGG